jgi:hypothetical protein
MSARAEFNRAMAEVKPVADHTGVAVARTAHAWLRLTNEIAASAAPSAEARIEAVVAVRDAQHTLRRLADLLGEIGLRFDAALGVAAGDKPQ